MEGALSGLFFPWKAAAVPGSPASGSASSRPAPPSPRARFVSVLPFAAQTRVAASSVPKTRRSAQRSASSGSARSSSACAPSTARGEGEGAAGVVVSEKISSPLDSRNVHRFLMELSRRQAAKKQLARSNAEVASTAGVSPTWNKAEVSAAADSTTRSSQLPFEPPSFFEEAHIPRGVLAFAKLPKHRPDTLQQRRVREFSLDSTLLRERLGEGQCPSEASEWLLVAALSAAGRRFFEQELSFQRLVGLRAVSDKDLSDEEAAALCNCVDLQLSLQGDQLRLLLSSQAERRARFLIASERAALREVKSQIAEVRQELFLKSQKILSLLDELGRGHSSNAKSLTLCARLRGRVFRYLAQFTEGLVQFQCSLISEGHFKEAVRAASALPPWHELRVEAVTSYAACLYTCGKEEEALALARETARAATVDLSEVPEESFPKVTASLRTLLRLMASWGADSKAVLVSWPGGRRTNSFLFRG